MTCTQTAHLGLLSMTPAHCCIHNKSDHGQQSHLNKNKILQYALNASCSPFKSPTKIALDPKLCKHEEDSGRKTTFSGF